MVTWIWGDDGNWAAHHSEPSRYEGGWTEVAIGEVIPSLSNPTAAYGAGETRTANWEMEAP